MDEANDRPGEHLPWVRENDLMPARSASAYVRIPVEIETIRQPREPEPNNNNNDVAAPTPTPSPEPSATSTATIKNRDIRRHRTRPEPARQPDKPRPAARGPHASAGLSLSVALALLGLLGLLVASLTFATATAILLLPAPARLTAAIVTAMVLGLVAFPGMRWTLGLVGLWPFRFESLEGLTSARFSTLEAIKRRAELRTIASARRSGEEITRAKDALATYLSSHPLGNKRDGRSWQDLGLRGETLERLEQRTTELLAAGRSETDGGKHPVEWLKSFEEGIVAPLDAAAHRRVEEHAWKTFKAAAASPNAGIDALVTLAWGSTMLDDLGRIYNVRIGRFGGAALLVRLLVDNDLAGRSDQPEANEDANIEPSPERNGDCDEFHPDCGFREMLEHHRLPTAEAEFESLLSNGANAFGLRAESGLHHYFLMRRLGTQAIRLLQPLSRR